MPRLVPTILALAALSACAPQQESALVAPPADVGGSPGPYPVQFRCPAATTIVETTTVGVTRYYGAKPADPEICLVQQPGHTQQSQMLYGLFVGNVAESPQMREAFRQFFPLVPGRQVHHTLLGTGSQWMVTMTALGPQRVTVPAGSFNAEVIEIREDGFGFNHYAGLRRIAFDTDTWVPVKWENEVLRSGVTLAPSWEATRIYRAPAQ